MKILITCLDFNVFPNIVSHFSASSVLHASSQLWDVLTKPFHLPYKNCSAYLPSVFAGNLVGPRRRRGWICPHDIRCGDAATGEYKAFGDVESRDLKT